MSLTSIEGILVALVFILPGAMGLQLRSYLWSGTSGGSTENLISAIAFSTGGLLFVEFATAVAGWVSSWSAHFGDFLLKDLVTSSNPIAAASPATWSRYLLFAIAVILLPSLLRWLRERPWIIAVKKTGHLSLESVGFEALFEESVKEAAKWDTTWEGYARDGLHVMVETDDDRRFQGEMMWRSTAPEPPEIILINVLDVTDSAAVFSMDGLALFRAQTLRRIWILKPVEKEQEGAVAASEGARNGAGSVLSKKTGSSK